ncbi:MAG: GNAT family N-acetyltransferase [Lachnospiraceae bacterium]|nr:GNAT family N-acetyltransferase [Lachnospiraceae bacterium]
MKKKSIKNEKDRIKVFSCEQPEVMLDILKKRAVFQELKYPYTEGMLKLLKETNPFRQTYHYIESGESFAFFIIYESRMNIMTLGNSEWMMNVKTVGFPCSLSNSGYVTNDLEFLLSYCKRIKGGKLILNVDEPVKIKGMGFGETLPSCVLSIKKEYRTIDDYVASLRSQYRRRIRLAEKRCRGVSVYRKEISDSRQNADTGKFSDVQNTAGTADKKVKHWEIYPLYLNTYRKSEYKLECLDRKFFEESEGTRLVFVKDGRPAGFVLLHEEGEKLVFQFCGMDYESMQNTADLYFFMLLHIVGFAIEKNLTTIDFGQTSELTKMKFGAELSKRYFYAHHTNPFLNMFAILGKRLLEYRYDFPDFKVFRME